MTEMTTVKVEKPVVDWLNTIKGLLEWKSGKKYTLNEAFIVILASYDVRQAISEGKLNPIYTNKTNLYLQNRLKQFWGDSELPGVHMQKKDLFFKKPKKYKK